MSTATASYATATDGVSLAYYQHGDPAAPTVVCVHGYPDNHTVWDGVVPLLTDRFHVVAYDVRGTGESGEPAGRDGYRIGQLADDLATIIAAVDPDRPIHLLAHDWGSIQSWGAVTDPRFAGRLASYTSISGPSLDMAGRWLRHGLRHPRDLARQLLDSYYIAAFQLPVLPELSVRTGVIDALVTRSARIGVPPDQRKPAVRRPQRDAINGIELYRANILSRPGGSRPGRAVCPVLVLAPLDDAHVTVPLATQAPEPFVDDLRTQTIPGNHWVVEQDPQLIADCFTEFVTSLDEG
ncbi:alpha/beta fold hydrolase [Nocardioides sp.]|uniref:alpha/beta fold hydrolase n=1 Tax=Nocardioides sp. TaxID=35761 RepID=UPI0039E2E8E4